MAVVVVEVLGENDLEVAATEDEQTVQALPADVANESSATALARGARTGVLMIRMPSAAKTASKAEVNFASRSRIKNLTGVGRHARSAGVWARTPGQ
jgi:hypothetical protein